MAPSPPPSKSIQISFLNDFEALHRLATVPNHLYVYEWSDEEEKDGTISVFLLERNPLTGEYIRILQLLDQFAIWEDAGLLDRADVVAPEDIVQVRAYVKEINEKLERDAPLLMEKIAKHRMDCRLDPIAEKEEEDEDSAVASSESELNTINEDEEPDSSNIESGSSHLETILEEEEEDSTVVLPLVAPTPLELEEKVVSSDMNRNHLRRKLRMIF